MLLADFIKRGIAELETLYPQSESRSLILLLTEELLGTKSYTHIIEPLWEIPESSMEVLQKSLQRLLAGEPLQYVLGKTEFCGRQFKVGPEVLIPRPETEQLCQEVISHCASAPSLKVLDLCTGSGCIAWTLAASLNRPSVTAVDISGAALSLARSQNISALQVPDFIQDDVLAPVLDYGQYDVIVSNPPYIKDSQKAQMRSNVLDYEPALALFVPDDNPLIFYKALALWCRKHLKQGGYGIFEINDLLAAQTAEVFRKEGLKEVSILCDCFEMPRFISLRG